MLRRGVTRRRDAEQHRQYTFYMLNAGTEIAVLLERSPSARFARPDARAAIELAVTELVDALRNHHCGTADHSNRLAGDCRIVAEELGLDPADVFEIELVAILHDIGKLAVPARILDLARPLEGHERALVRSHSVRGAEMLAEIAGLRHLAVCVRASHERWDGTGYPDELRGLQIPLAARVVATVDAFDAMTNDRPYRRALEHEEARRRITAGAGHAFDPHVVRALLDSLG
jgi:HD-GYP domain-containing protein (c-di-GMP phosphodiesterase class II)